MRLVQLQHQYRDGTRDFVAQNEFESLGANRDFQSWVDDVRSRHPLPDGAQWLVVDEKSKCFFYQAAESDDETEAVEAEVGE